MFDALNTNEGWAGQTGDEGCGLVLQYKYDRMQGAGLCKLINFKRGLLVPCRESQRASMSVRCWSCPEQYFVHSKSTYLLSTM